MTENPEFNNFEATVILRKAMSMQKIDIHEDLLFKDLENAKWEREMTRYTFASLGTTMSALILYKKKYKLGMPWVQVIGRLTGIFAFWTFFYWTSPGVRRYNQVLIEISKSKKKELLEIFQPKTS